MLTNPIKSFFYNLLLSKPLWNAKFVLKEKLWGWITKPGFMLSTKLHGKKSVIPSDYIYPSICRTYPAFNNPLLELCWQTWLVKNERINIIDAGAAVGDTLYFLKQNLPENSTHITCIEGFDFFYQLLKKNAETFTDCIALKATLSSERELIPGLMNTHSSSATSLGEMLEAAYPLDEIWQNEVNLPVDIIKIDVDGYDGKVISGSSQILKTFSPSVIFEFHPLLIHQTRTDFYIGFETLLKQHYQQLLWFDKFGNFVSQTEIDDNLYIEKMIKQCLDEGEKEDIHFDIIAPGNRIPLDLNALAKCEYAKTKKYPY